MWLNLLLSFGLVAFAAASPSSKDKPTFRKCDNYTGEQARLVFQIILEIISASMHYRPSKVKKNILEVMKLKMLSLI